MDMRGLSRYQRVREWERRIKACGTSGLSVVSWCKENDINSKTYYRWEHICLEEASKRVEGMDSETGLVRIEPQMLATERPKVSPPATVSESNLVIRYGKISILRRVPIQAVVVDT